MFRVLYEDGLEKRGKKRDSRKRSKTQARERVRVRESKRAREKKAFFFLEEL